MRGNRGKLSYLNSISIYILAFNLRERFWIIVRKGTSSLTVIRFPQRNARALSNSGLDLKDLAKFNHAGIIYLFSDHFWNFRPIHSSQYTKSFKSQSIIYPRIVANIFPPNSCNPLCLKKNTAPSNIQKKFFSGFELKPLQSLTAV